MKRPDLEAMERYVVADSRTGEMLRWAKHLESRLAEAEEEALTLRGLLASLVDALEAYRADNHPAHWECIDGTHDEAAAFLDAKDKIAKPAEPKPDG